MRTDRYKDIPEKKKLRPLPLLLVIILVLAASIAALVFYSYRSAMASLSLEFTDPSPVLEFGQSCSSMDFAKAHEGELAAEPQQPDTSVVGEGSIKYTVSKKLFGGLLNPSKSFELVYSVKDSVSPVILWNGSGTVLERGSEFDINKVIAYGDNADPKPSVKVDGKVDMSKNGSYTLNISVSDASGNSEKCSTTVEVADELPSYEDSEDRTSFKDFVKANKGEGRSFGIDVSAWQDDVDFEKVKAAGCEFVIIRIGYSEKGKVTLDKKFEQNLKRAREAGLKIGVYMYSYDNTSAYASEAAEWVADKLGGESLDLPVAFDWEDFGAFQSYGMSFADLNGMYDAFAGTLAEAGYDCMLYGSRNYLEKVWAKTDTRPVWLAHYTDKTDYSGPYMLWQASCTGRIDGIDGAVDMDILYEK